MAKNAVLQRHADTQYQAGTWDRARRVVIKAEVVRLGDRAPRDNPRFVVTNLRQTPQFVYERIYCARGDIENRIKELLDGLQIDRTSCCRFWANQLRVLLTAAAYVLMQELRLRAARTACARAQVTWLRDRLLKLGAHVVGSVRRVVLHLPTATPDLQAWRHIRARTRQPPGIAARGRTPRRTEIGDAPVEQGEKKENTGSIRPMNNDDQRDAAPIECSGAFATGC